MEGLVSLDEKLSSQGYVFPVIRAETFVDYLLPSLKNAISLNLVKSILKKKGHVDSRGRWKSFWVMSEGKRRKRYDTFTPLLDIFKEATSATSSKAPHLERVLDTELLQERVKGRCSKNKSSQTACFSFRSGQSVKACGKEASWLNVALTASFRRTADDASRKQVSALL